MSDRLRAIAALSLGLVALSSLGAPTSAAGTTRWVDDDGQAGPTACDSTRTARSTVQAALDVAHVGDTVKVCPGVYEGTVWMGTKGVTLRSVKPLKATLKPPSAPISGGPAVVGAVVAMDADATNLVGFRIALGATGACEQLTGVTVFATGVEVRGNQIVGRTDDQSTDCGLDAGILVLDDSSGLVMRNRIRNYASSGIRVEDSGLVRVVENSVTWAHTGSTATLPAGAPSAPGIAIIRSRARVLGNTVVATEGSMEVPSHGGIIVAPGTVAIRDNLVEGFDYGITAGYASRGFITGNRIRNGDSTGLLIYDTGPGPTGTVPVFTIKDNRVRGFGDVGIAIDDAPGNLLEDNNATGNPGMDCVESPLPRQSVWRRNLGNDATPVNLCKQP